MPIPLADHAKPEPPSWWMLLTANQRHTVLARLNKMGLDVSAWPR